MSGSISSTAVVSQLDQLVAQYQKYDQALKEINKRVREYRESMQDKEIKEQKKALANALYETMYHMGLNEYGGIKISKVMPSKVKAQLIEELREEQFEETIRDEVPTIDEQVEDLTQLTSKLLKVSKLRLETAQSKKSD